MPERTQSRLAGSDGNPGTAPDPAWLPLLVTPPFPDHPSGHTCATAARMAIWHTVLDSDRIAFHAYSEATRKAFRANSWATPPAPTSRLATSRD